MNNANGQGKVGNIASPRLWKLTSKVEVKNEPVESVESSLLPQVSHQRLELLGSGEQYPSLETMQRVGSVPPSSNLRKLSNGGPERAASVRTYDRHFFRPFDQQ